MDYYQLQTNALLAERGAQMIRKGTSKHRVYKIPGKRNFTMSKTPSDVFASKKQLATLRRILGLTTGKPKATVETKSPRSHRKSRKVAPEAAELKAPARRTLRTELAHALDPYLIPAGTPLPELPTRAKYRKEREHHEVAAAYAPTPEVLAEANQILATQGDKAMHDFLNHHRKEFILAANRPKSKEKQEPPMSKLDLTLTAAQRQIVSIDRAIKEASDRKQHAESAVVQADAAIATFNQQRKDCMEYIASYDLATAQAALVEKIVPVMMPSVNGHRTRTPNAGATVMSVVNEMLESRSKISAAELVEACEKKGIQVKKGTVYTTLAYHAAKANPTLEKVGTAIYAKRTNGLAASA